MVNGEFDNWFHQFSFVARAYQWDTHEKMVRLMSCLRGPAVTAHRSLPHGERDNYDSCIDLLRKRYGNDRPIAKTTLRADVSAIRQEEGESLDMFADRVYALTVEAYPEMERGNLLDSLAIPAFLKGIRDRSAVQEALKFSNPSTIRAAVETVLHIQCAARTLGVRGMSARQVVLEDEPAVISSETLSETTAVGRVIWGVVRHLQQSTISPKLDATSTSGTYFTCGGRGHRARDCANKRRHSPSPLTCFECSGKGHLARKCSNTLRRRDPPGKPPNRRHRRWSSTSSGSSSSTDSEDVHGYRRGHRRHSPRRRRSHSKGNHGSDRNGSAIMTVSIGMMGRTCISWTKQRP